MENKQVIMKKYEGGKIVDVDGYVHIVNGKIICFSSDVYDLSEFKDRENVLLFSEDLYVEKGLKQRYGKSTVCVLKQLSDGKNTPVLYHIDDMPTDVQNVIREVCHEYCE